MRRSPFPYDYVLPRVLAQGSAPSQGDPRITEHFDRVVLSAMEYQPRELGVRRVDHVPLDDARPSVDEIRRAIVEGREVARAIRRGERVLVTCAMGMNRSGLITGLALIELGYSARDAIARIRAARGEHALSNRDFVRVLELHAARRAA